MTSDFSVIAEGVETQAQHHRIAAMGCDSAQGYFYAHPMAASAIRDHQGTPPAARNRSAQNTKSSLLLRPRPTSR